MHQLFLAGSSVDQLERVFVRHDVVALGDKDQHGRTRRPREAHGVEMMAQQKPHRALGELSPRQLDH